MNTLLPEDLNHVVRSLPKDVRELVKASREVDPLNIVDGVPYDG